MGDIEMIQMIDLDLQRKACVWFNESPELLYPVVEVMNQDLATGLEQNSHRKQVALELLIPVGAKMSYGLLGVEFILNSSEKLLIELWISTENERIFEKSIANKLDTIRIGLPLEYSQSVIEGIKISLDENLISNLGSGILRINQAAHGEISSSNKFFKRISMILMQLLILDRIHSQKKVTEIIKNCSLV